MRARPVAVIKAAKPASHKERVGRIVLKTGKRATGFARRCPVPMRTAAGYFRRGLRLGLQTAMTTQVQMVPRNAPNPQ